MILAERYHPPQSTRLLSANRTFRVRAVSQLGDFFDGLEEHLTQGLETVAKAQKLAEAGTEWEETNWEETNKP